MLICLFVFLFCFFFVLVIKGKYKVICYYTNWSWYRQGQGKFSPSNIDLDLCTHIIYGFATLDPNNLIMKVFDNWCDTDEYGPKLYDQITALKKKGVQVLIALGGWNDSLGSKYSRMVNDPAARKRFVDNAIAFIDKFGFQGLDLDWEYPKCWQVRRERLNFFSRHDFKAKIGRYIYFFFFLSF